MVKLTMPSFRRWRYYILNYKIRFRTVLIAFGVVGVWMLFTTKLRGYKDTGIQRRHKDLRIQGYREHRESGAIDPEDLLLTDTGQAFSQEDLNYFASTVAVRYKVLHNVDGLLNTAEVTIINTGYRLFPWKQWEIIFSQVHLITSLGPTNDVSLQKLKGPLYSIQPWGFMAPRGDLEPGDRTSFQIVSKGTNTGYSSVMPNWYINVEGLEARVLQSTAGNSRKFVAPYIDKDMWKRGSKDKFDPLSADERFSQHGVKDLGVAPLPVIPTPLKIVVHTPSKTLNVKRGKWKIVCNSFFKKECAFLQKLWGLNEGHNYTDNYVIAFAKANVLDKRTKGIRLSSRESYKLLVSTSKQRIIIKAPHSAGAFYAIQTLVSLGDGNGNGISETKIIDAPRYKYRGVMLDVARHFHSKDTVIKLLEVMAMYKLNKFHFHLTDDEGWRLQVEGLEELTELGAVRCHDTTERRCILPMYGSGPHREGSGTGFYTAHDYRDILRHATARHIEVIPEIDVPGHCHAAIKAMEARYATLRETDPAAAEEYLLSDPDDISNYSSIQNYNDSAINPCLSSTYVFISKVLDTLVNMHKDISPLRVFSFGGDEFPRNALLGSPRCREQLLKYGTRGLKKIFVDKVGAMLASYGLDMAAWTDGLMAGEALIPREDFPLKNVYAFARHSSQIDNAYNFANSGFKTIVTPANFLYYDHPYEPDPEEPGLIWATRYMDTRKVFGLTPENMTNSKDKNMNGEPVRPCKLCPPLIEKQNIEGLQATLFGELVRDEGVMEYMLLPRMLALAERAWHKARWETKPEDLQREYSMNEDWINFANTLGYRELGRLEELGYKYRIPPPGGLWDGTFLYVSVSFPGLQIHHRVEGEDSWTRVVGQKTSIRLPVGVRFIRLRSSVPGTNRYSREVQVDCKMGAHAQIKPLL